MARLMNRPGPSPTRTSAISLPKNGTPISNEPSNFSSTAGSNQTHPLAAITELPNPVKLVLASIFLTICLVYFVAFRRERMLSVSPDEEMATFSKALEDCIERFPFGAEVEKDRKESRPSANSR